MAEKTKLFTDHGLRGLLFGPPTPAPTKAPKSEPTPTKPAPKPAPAAKIPPLPGEKPSPESTTRTKEDSTMRRDYREDTVHDEGIDFDLPERRTPSPTPRATAPAPETAEQRKKRRKAELVAEFKRTAEDDEILEEAKGRPVLAVWFPVEGSDTAFTEEKFRETFRVDPKPADKQYIFTSEGAHSKIERATEDDFILWCAAEKGWHPRR